MGERERRDGSKRRAVEKRERERGACKYSYAPTVAKRLTEEYDINKGRTHVFFTSETMDSLHLPSPRHHSNLYRGFATSPPSLSIYIYMYR